MPTATPGDTRPHRRQRRGLLLLALLLLIALGYLRENGSITLEYARHKNHTETQSQTTISRAVAMDGPCRLSCTSDPTICEAAIAASGCTAVAPAAVQGELHIEAEGSCWTPLFKSSEVQFGAVLRATEVLDDHPMPAIPKDGFAPKVTPGTLEAMGSVQLDASGPMSCYSYRRLQGRAVGNAVAEALAQI